jgi:hypothetical protein
MCCLGHLQWKMTPARTVSNSQRRNYQASTVCIAGCQMYALASWSLNPSEDLMLNTPVDMQLQPPTKCACLHTSLAWMKMQQTRLRTDARTKSGSGRKGCPRRHTPHLSPNSEEHGRATAKVDSEAGLQSHLRSANSRRTTFGCSRTARSPTATAFAILHA